MERQDFGLPDTRTKTTMIEDSSFMTKLIIAKIGLQAMRITTNLYFTTYCHVNEHLEFG
jgi:hypothetical protein